MGCTLKKFILLYSLLLFFSSVGLAEVAIPPLRAHITDTAGLLSPQMRQQLEFQLNEFEQTKGSQVTVLTINTTEGEAIEQFSIRVAESWKIGRKKIDDGAILVIAKADRKLRIEVGYGLEGILPDATCKQIIENFITPQFRAGNYEGGIQAGVTAILTKLSGEELPPPQVSKQEDNVWMVFAIIICWLLFISFFGTGRNSGRFYSSGGTWGGGGWSGGGGGGFSGGGGSFGGGGASGSW